MASAEVSFPQASAPSYGNYRAKFGGCSFQDVRHLVVRQRNQEQFESAVSVLRRSSDSKLILNGQLLDADGRPVLQFDPHGEPIPCTQGLVRYGTERHYRILTSEGRCILDMFQPPPGASEELIASFVTHTADGRLIAFHPDRIVLLAQGNVQIASMTLEGAGPDNGQILVSQTNDPSPIPAVFPVGFGAVFEEVWINKFTCFFAYA